MRSFLGLSLLISSSLALPTPLKSWTAGSNQFSSWTLSEKQSLLGTVLDYPMPKEITTYEAVNDIPTNFDSRDKWPACVGAVRDQGKCGSCWAESLSEAFGDRLCIHTNESRYLSLSAQDLVSCDKYGNMGCNGGIPYLAWTYVELAGLVSDSCMPYTSGGGDSGTCPKSCQDGSKWVAHKAKLGSVKHYGSNEAIQSEILANGPVQTSFKVYEDFMDYSSGVYQHTTGKFLGGHAVKLVGWGHDETSGLDYWTCQNSWTESWGEKGFFRILRGKNECGIEAGAIAGIPAENTPPSALNATLGADSRFCTICKQAADAIVNKLINVVFQAGVVGGCADLCGHLPKPTEQKICDGLCVLAGEAAFVTALKEVQINPEALCYKIHACKE